MLFGQSLRVVRSIVPLCLSLFLIVSCGGGGGGGDGETSSTTTGYAGDGQLDQVVEAVRQKYDLPAVAAIMIRNGQIIERSAMGKRSVDAITSVTENDQWHIGSITKSMTSLLAALLVRDGLIQWTSTLADIFPELMGTMLIDYHDVRLDELLSHTSGLQRDIPNYGSYFTDARPLRVQRLEVVNYALVLPPAGVRGNFEYSNLGYIIAGAMLERVTGSDWETLLSTYLLDPLAMSETGFGSPDPQGILAQPIGHWLDNDSWQPAAPSVVIYNLPAVYGPAGDVHVSLDDMAAYLGLQLRGLEGETVAGFLTAQEFAKLHTPIANVPDYNGYALGWYISDFFIQHSGSNLYWYALANINKYRNAAFFIVTNSYDDVCSPDCRSTGAIYELRNELYKRFDAAFL